MAAAISGVSLIDWSPSKALLCFEAEKMGKERERAERGRVFFSETNFFSIKRAMVRKKHDLVLPHSIRALPLLTRANARRVHIRSNERERERGRGRETDKVAERERSQRERLSKARAPIKRRCFSVVVVGIARQCSFSLSLSLTLFHPHDELTSGRAGRRPGGSRVSSSSPRTRAGA